MKRFRLYLSPLLLTVLVVFALPPVAPVAAKQPAAGEAGQGRKAQLIGELLSQYHYREHKIDDTLSEQVLKTYLDILDRERYYFLQEDIAQFNAYAKRLDDSLLEGDLGPARMVFARYQQRIQERADFASDLLKQKLSFDADERLELDRSELPWSKDKAELDALWRKRVKHDALTLQATGQKWDEVYEILTKRYQRLARTVTQYSAEEIFQTYMNAWAQVFDPHTSYMSPRLSENFDIHMRLSLQGIGAMLKSENDFTEVVELVPGGPADKSGQLQPGDRIIGIGDTAGDIVDVVGWRLEDVVDRIRGPKETQVRLQIVPKKGDGNSKVITLTRNEVKLEEQAAKAKTVKVEQDGEKLNVGVITIPGFYIDFAAADAGDENYRSTTRDVRVLLDKLKKDGIDGLVIDLRGNGGGSLKEAAELTGLFVRGGPVVQVRRQDGEVEVLRDHDDRIAYSGPLAVLVDHNSASASEIFAAAIQDYGRGVVIGHKTYGKGTVQTLVDLDRFSLRPKDPAGRLKLTIAKFYRINGASTQRLGVLPDIILPMAAANEEDFGENSIETALPWDEIKGVPYQPVGQLGDVLPLLRERHESRAKESAAFKALVDEIAQIRELQNRKSVSLSQAVRDKERQEAEDAQLRSINRRLAAYAQPPLKSLDDVKEDDLPDTLLDATAAIVADLERLDNGRATASRWNTPKDVAQ